MAFNSSGGLDEPIASINITPLVDVSLVLVIIFMITMPYLMERSLKVSASSQAVVKASSAQEPVLVEISSHGIRVDGRGADIGGLEETLKAILLKRNDRSVAVAADPDVPHGVVVEVLDKAAASGADDLEVVDPASGGGHGPA